MDFSLTDEQQLLLDSVRELMERGNYDNYFKECDAKGELPQKAIDAAVEAGFATLGIPEEFGGTPCDELTKFLVAEEAIALGWPSLCWVNQSLEVDDSSRRSSATWASRASSPSRSASPSRRPARIPPPPRRR